MSDDTNVIPFKMAPCPGMAPDWLIHQISDQQLLNAETLFSRNPLNQAKPEHPLAAKLYRDFRAGSQIMTKPDAYRLGNELDSLLKQNLDLHAEMAAKIADARETVARLLEMIRQLQGPAQ